MAGVVVSGHGGGRPESNTVEGLCCCARPAMGCDARKKKRQDCEDCLKFCSGRPEVISIAHTLWLNTCKISTLSNGKNSASAHHADI
jgi:hypothetical protein